MASARCALSHGSLLQSLPSTSVPGSRPGLARARWQALLPFSRPFRCAAFCPHTPPFASRELPPVKRTPSASFAWGSRRGGAIYCLLLRPRPFLQSLTHSGPAPRLSSMSVRANLGSFILIGLGPGRRGVLRAVQLGSSLTVAAHGMAGLGYKMATCLRAGKVALGLGGSFPGVEAGRGGLRAVQ